MTESVSEAINKASSFIGESIPVVDDENRLLGVVTEADLFSEYLRVQEKLTFNRKRLKTASRAFKLLGQQTQWQHLFIISKRFYRTIIDFGHSTYFVYLIVAHYL